MTQQRNYKKEIELYQQEVIQLKAENIALRVALDDVRIEADNLWETVRKKESESTKEK